MANQLTSVTLDGTTQIPVKELSAQAQEIIALYNKVLVDREYTLNKFDFTLQGISVQLKIQLDGDFAPKAEAANDTNG